LGGGGYALIPPSEIDGRKYRHMNNKPIKSISTVIFNKIVNFFLRVEPEKKRLRKPFFDIIIGKIDIEEQCQMTGLNEHVYWEFLYKEAYHQLELQPEDLFPILEKTQPAFNYETTRTQLQYVDLDEHPLKNETIKEYFPADDSIKVRERKKQDEPYYVTIADILKDKYDIITMDDSDQLLLRKGNTCTDKLKDFKADLAEEIAFMGKSIIHTYNSVIHWIKNNTRFEREKFCYDNWTINFQNGYYDIITETFYPHNEYKDKLFCYEIPHMYVEGEHNCPKFKIALSQWLGTKNKITMDDIFEMIGYSMTMNVSLKMAFFIYGPSHTGKTQFQTVLEHVIGHQNRANISLQRMTKDQFGTHGLAFKILNMVGDMSNLKVDDVSQFKTITGGDEYVDAEVKGGKQYQFINMCKIWYNGNRIPVLKEDDQAFYNRWILIPFFEEFLMHEKTTVSDLGKKLVADENEILGIIYEALQGARRLYKRKWFRKGLIRNTKHIWKYQAEPVFAFLYDKTIHDKTQRIPCIEFRDRINLYLSNRGLRPHSSYRLTQELERYNIYRMRKQGDDIIREYYYLGIKWKKELKDFIE